MCCSNREDTRHLNEISGIHGVVDEIEVFGAFSAAVADDSALDTTNVFSADTTDVRYAAKALPAAFSPAKPVDDKCSPSPMGFRALAFRSASRQITNRGETVAGLGKSDQLVFIID